MWHAGIMDPRRRLLTAIKNRDRTIAAAAQALTATHDAIADAIRHGMPVHEAVELTGYHRNTIARICRNRDVPDRRRKPQQPPAGTL